MATRSYIGVLYPKNVVMQVYCHFDGYPSWNGVLLYKYYDTVQKVEELIKFGSLSCIGRYLYDPARENSTQLDKTMCEPHCFTGKCVEEVQAHTYPYVPTQQYNYLFSVAEGCWLVKHESWHDWLSLAYVIKTTPEALISLKYLQDIDGQ